MLGVCLFYNVMVIYMCFSQWDRRVILPVHFGSFLIVHLLLFLLSTRRFWWLLIDIVQNISECLNSRVSRQFFRAALISLSLSSLFLDSDYWLSCYQFWGFTPCSQICLSQSFGTLTFRFQVFNPAFFQLIKLVFVTLLS